ncbi:hypothetical protein A3K82_01120 [Candidatus Pacearchaeota archaeon RBG_19FT_COMBO_34_9]|nr:MAG: hypothetical protein A3K82_01120 [Candidatus Pacearchaeota archaeon RBG_19FT_COMBO_34_9]OGJ16510.1 MAG: hypothetical protein A3K74_00150 [Candidatus Pacearchaeota archaeon RBG_13_33_26]
MLNKRGLIRKFSLYNFFPKNRRGQGLSTNAIILIILGLILLVLLIVGFVTGWAPIKNLISPTNVDNVVEDCISVCGFNQKFSFCSAERTLRVNEDKFTVKTSCAVLANVSNFEKYDVKECPSIDCDLSCEDILIDSKKGASVPAGTYARYDVSALANNLEEGQICIIN